MTGSLCRLPLAVLRDRGPGRRPYRRRRFVKAGGPGRASSMVGTPRRIAADSIRAGSQLRRQKTRPKTLSCQVPNRDSHHFWQSFHAGFGVSGWPNTPHGAGNEARWRGAKGVQHYQVMWWRRRRDSNPRDGSPSAPLAGVCLRPLGHVSDASSIRGGWPETRAKVALLTIVRPARPGSGNGLAHADGADYVARVGSLAQLVERLAYTENVGSSSLSRPTIPRMTPGSRAAWQRRL